MPFYTLPPLQPPPVLGLGLPPRRLSDNTWGALFFAGSLLAIGTIVWATTRIPPAKALSGAATNREGMTWEEWRNAALYAIRPPHASPFDWKPSRKQTSGWRRLWQEGVDPVEVREV